MRLRDRGHVLSAQCAQPVPSPSWTMPRVLGAGLAPHSGGITCLCPHKASFPPCLDAPRASFPPILALPEPCSLHAPAPRADSRAAEVAAASPFGTAELTGFI